MFDDLVEKRSKIIFIFACPNVRRQKSISLESVVIKCSHFNSMAEIVSQIKLEFLWLFVPEESSLYISWGKRTASLSPVALKAANLDKRFTQGFDLLCLSKKCN